LDSLGRTSTDEALELDRLRSGAAVSLLCGLADAWLEGDPSLMPQSAFFMRVRSALEEGALEDIPDLRAALEAGLHDANVLEAQLPAVYLTYVRGYFDRYWVRPDT
jgi:hypothetical protein